MFRSGSLMTLAKLTEMGANFFFPGKLRKVEAVAAVAETVVVTAETDQNARLT